MEIGVKSMERWQRVMYQPNIALGENGEKVTASIKHRNLAKNAAKEGMVLLKNNSILPLEKGCKVALFGKGTFDYVKGGGGSGDVTVEYTVNLYEGLKNLSSYVSVCETTLDFYRKKVEEQYNNGICPGMTTEPELPEELCTAAAAYTDTAIISICRFSGEGWDRKSTYDKKTNNDEKEVFEEGDFYLSHREKAMIATVKKYFQKIIVVMNVGGMVDTEWFKNDNGIQAVLMAWQGGIEGGNAAAELLCGIGNPSGKLCDTFAKHLEDYPSTYNFHENDKYVNYTEDIYVGYRYFETIKGKDEAVNYPFGFGLSYTDFRINTVSVNSHDEYIDFEICVTNTGNVAGKEVVQIYVNAPAGLLGKASKSLVAFKKTRLLEPGEIQSLFISTNIYDMASYDDLGKIQKSAYILEKGDYRFFVGNSVRNGEYTDYIYRVNEDKVLKQLSSRLVPYRLEKRLLCDGTYEELPTGEKNDFERENREISETEKTEMSSYDPVYFDGFTPAVRNIQQVCLWRNPYKENVRLFKDVDEGKISMEDFVKQFTDEELVYLLGGQPNTGVANTFGIGNMPDYGVPSVMTADGPAGLRIEKKCGVNTTAWPCSTMLACTWNEEIVYAVGEAGAKEVKENNIGVWLTPAVNIHRSPLCGRNFEYYSEDPRLAGKLAAAMVRGIQSQHIAATVKHFALNNKETDRKDSDSRVSERAAREIYLKTFEIIVKEAGPWCIMTSYNIVNGHRTSENKELLEGILRGEWGFDGMVTTDWWTFGEHYKESKAGNDLKMACGFPQRLIEAKEKGLITREEMEKCAKNILNLILKID